MNNLCKYITILLFFFNQLIFAVCPTQPTSVVCTLTNSNTNTNGNPTPQDVQNYAQCIANSQLANSQLVTTNTANQKDCSTGIQVAPTYTNSSTSLSDTQKLYNNGQGNLINGGVTAVSNCANVSSDDPYCSAVNTTVNAEPQNVTTANDPKQFNITQQSSIVAQSQTEKQTLNNIFNGAVKSGGSLDAGIAAAFQSSLIGMTGSTNNTTACTTQTTTNPSVYNYKTCFEVNTATSQSCTEGLIVNIATNTNYQCNENVSNYTTPSCSKILNVTPANKGNIINVSNSSSKQRISTNSLDYFAHVTSTCGSDSYGFCLTQTTVTNEMSIQYYMNSDASQYVLTSYTFPLTDSTNKLLIYSSVDQNSSIYLEPPTPTCNGNCHNLSVYVFAGDICAGICIITDFDADVQFTTSSLTPPTSSWTDNCTSLENAAK